MSRFYKICLFAVLLAAGGGLRADAADAARLVPTLLEDGVMYLRIGGVENGVAGEIATARAAFATNRILGTILDLRFVGGGDPAGVPAAAALFAGKKLPLAVLVNGRTRGAAAVLAATLRAERAGLVFGGAAGGIQPDIAVAVGEEEERVFLRNPYAVPVQSVGPSGPITNDFAPFIDHTSEADLVRAKIKDGDEEAEPLPPRPAEPQKPLIQDPVLARAVDWIKALASLRPLAR